MSAIHYNKLHHYSSHPYLPMENETDNSLDKKLGFLSVGTGLAGIIGATHLIGASNNLLRSTHRPLPRALGRTGIISAMGLEVFFGSLLGSGLVEVFKPKEKENNNNYDNLPWV